MSEQESSPQATEIRKYEDQVAAAREIYNQALSIATFRPERFDAEAKATAAKQAERYAKVGQSREEVQGQYTEAINNLAIAEGLSETERFNILVNALSSQYSLLSRGEQTPERSVEIARLREQITTLNEGIHALQELQYMHVSS